MKPSKWFFWIFWAVLCLIAGVTLVANIRAGHIPNIVIVVLITAFLTSVSVWLYKRLFKQR